MNFFYNSKLRYLIKIVLIFISLNLEASEKYTLFVELFHNSTPKKFLSNEIINKLFDNAMQKIIGLPKETNQLILEYLLNSNDFIVRSADWKYIDNKFISHPATIERILANRQVDKKFGIYGLFICPFRNIYSLIVQANNKIVIAGMDIKISDKFLIARLNVNGTLDKTLGNGKGFIVAGSLYESDRSKGLIEQLDGKLICHFQTDSRNVIIRRYNADLSLDNKFGQKGEIKILDYIAHEISLFKDKIILVSDEWKYSSSGHNKITRIMNNGDIDKSFGKDGKIKIYHLNDIAFVNDSLFITLRDSEFGPVEKRWYGQEIQQICADGRINQNFKQHRIKGHSIKKIKIDHDGNILLAGDKSIHSYSDPFKTSIIVIRLLYNGQYDSRFAQNGVMTKILDCPYGGCFDSMETFLDKIIICGTLRYGDKGTNKHIIFILSQDGIEESCKVIEKFDSCQY